MEYPKYGKILQKDSQEEEKTGLEETTLEAEAPHLEQNFETDVELDLDRLTVDTVLIGDDSEIQIDYRHDGYGEIGVIRPTVRDGIELLKKRIHHMEQKNG